MLKLSARRANFEMSEMQNQNSKTEMTHFSQNCDWKSKTAMFFDWLSTVIIAATG